MTRPSRFRLAARGAAVAACALLAGSLPAGQGWYDYGRVEVDRSTPTPNGTWDGTWYLVNRDDRYALFIRTVDGKPQVKLQYQSISHPEAFETDWSGKSTYYLAGHPATFEIKLTRRTADEMQGTWNWQVDFSDSGRGEVGKFTMYRIGSGRNLMMRFSEFERQIRRNQALKRFPATPSYTFMKASKRVVLWDELPF